MTGFNPTTMKPKESETLKYGKLEILWGALRRPDLVLRFLSGKQPGEFDLDEVAKYVSSNSPHIVEAGAFDGRDTASFAKKYPMGTIYAFEPLPFLAQKVRLATSGLRNVSVIETALGTGECDFLVLHTFESNDDAHGSSSMLPPEDHLDVAPDIRFDAKISVPAITLDAWHASIGSPVIDLLWLDLQGAELLVLKHGEKLLRTTKTCHIEVTNKPLYSGGATTADVKLFFETRGFRLMAKRIPVRSGNAIFTRV